MIESRNDKISIAYSNYTLTGEVSSRTKRAIEIRCRDESQETGYRYFKLLYSDGKLCYLTHVNHIPLASFINRNGSWENVFFYHVRFLFQKHFDDVHLCHKGYRGAFSNFTHICDIALDHPFFIDEGSVNQDHVKSTIAHELTHRAVSELDFETYQQISDTFLERLDIWKEIVLGYYRYWGRNNHQQGTMQADGEAPWFQIIGYPRLSESEDGKLLFPYIREIIDELISKRASYMYRSTAAHEFIEFLNRTIFDKSMHIQTLLMRIKQETDSIQSYQFTNPILI